MREATAEQRAAIQARGNVLVVAGAGTGKTRTVIERCLGWLLADPTPASLEEILMVTFTEAAATEMRQRLREVLGQEVARHPGHTRLAEQLAWVDQALIGTLHSFCLRLVREHFYCLKLDPQVTVLPAEQATLLAEETLDRLLHRQYAEESPLALGVQELIYQQGQEWDQPVRELVLRIHRFACTLADPEGWFRREAAALAEARPLRWESLLAQGFWEWRNRWLSVLRDPVHENLQACRAALASVSEPLDRRQIADCLTRVLAANNWKRKEKKVRDPHEAFFTEAAFLQSAVVPGPDGDPLAQDWHWVRPHLAALLELTQEFSRQFAQAKRELGMVDFQDLEQFALRLLWDPVQQAPSPIGQRWRDQFRLIFVDEYQDINEAQHTILSALGRVGPGANRFLVGDLKQSIYGFRLAQPRIFQQCRLAWQQDPQQGAILTLSENFRSHEAILDFINAVFAQLMSPEIGGLRYDHEARLKFGARAQRMHFARESRVAAGGLSVASVLSPPRVELHLCLTERKEAGAAEDGENADESIQSDLEARLVADRLVRLRADGAPVWDATQQKFRPVEWQDIAILLRAPRSRAEVYAREFGRLGVPLYVARGGFFESLEISDILSLLQLLDNPLQDLALLGVLRSPLVGLSHDELALLRLAHPQQEFWTAVKWFHRQSGSNSNAVALRRKIDLFLQRYDRWRALARRQALSECLETVLDETLYEDWLASQPQGEQKLSNLRRFVRLTRQFDQFQRQGLFRFLNFVARQRDAEMEPETLPPVENAIRLLSIHHAKGLEFRVVVVPDLGRAFNFQALTERAILDEELGLCPQVKPPEVGGSYPSVPYWMARQRRKQELLSEEMRLLYVGFTRACDRLILAGSASQPTATKAWPEESLRGAASPDARCYLDWLGPWFAAGKTEAEWTRDGRDHLLEWFVYRPDDARLTVRAQPNPTTMAAPPLDFPSLLAGGPWCDRLAAAYPYAAATSASAKVSVSALRRKVNDDPEENGRALFPLPSADTTQRQVPTSRLVPRALSAAEIGTAHHKFLQHIPWGTDALPRRWDAQADALVEAGTLSAAERSVLDLSAVARFYESELGRRIQAQALHVHRELPFTVRLGAADLVATLGADRWPMVREGFWSAARVNGPAGEEFLVLQGVIDLAVILPNEIWLVDYKTDQIAPGQSAEKVTAYRPQLRLYGHALNRIYDRPVSEMWLHFLAVGQSVRL